MFAVSDHLLSLYQLELSRSINDWNVVNPASRRDAQLFNMRTQALLATPVRTLPARVANAELRNEHDRTQSTTEDPAPEGIEFDLSDAMADASAVDANCEKISVGSFPRRSSNDSSGLTRTHVANFANKHRH
ncbi:hypothetical protein B5807_03501 [Epicoccum nigrum]|jgi:hypothetical protein|uniref:Uncharacterized protein n=1 Tax=Epicoccum nigrum TaxID=105696 RepID=A0A1Y2M9A4_EPING|nr:hypothetical protein B5807_03501 [Epicoccum nigrum]